VHYNVFRYSISLMSIKVLEKKSWSRSCLGKEISWGRRNSRTSVS